MGFESQVQMRHRPAAFDALHGRLPQGVAIFDTDLRLAYANARWASFQTQGSGAACDAVPGACFAALLPGDDLLASARRCLQTGEAIHLLAGDRAPGNGETFWDLTLSPMVEDALVTGLICIAADATGRVEAERAAAAKARLAAFRADVSQALAGSDESDAVLQACAEAMEQHAPATFARIWVLDEAEDCFRLRASAGLYTRLNGTYARIPGDWIRRKTFGGYAPEVATDLRLTHHVREPEWAAAQGLVSWVNQPLTVRGRIIGFMAMFGRQNFDDDTLGELAAVADAIAQFLERKQAEAALRERELLFRGVFESAADGLVISDLDSGGVLAANPAFRAMHGHTHDELTRLTRDELVHPAAHDRLREHVAAIAAGDASRVRLRHRRRDGSVFPVATQGSPILYQGRPAILGIVRDVTQEQAAHEVLEQRVVERTRELRTLLDMSRTISLASELEPLLELIFDQMRQLVDYEAVAIGLIEGDAYTTVAVRRDELSQRSRNPLGLQFAVDPSRFLWRELATGKTLSTPNIAGDDDVAVGFRQLVGDRLPTTYAHVCSLLAAPLIVANELIGAMFISSTTEDRYQPTDIALVTAIANQIAVAIENARLHERTRQVATLEERQRLARELHDSVSQALFGIGLGAETARAMLDRDPAKAVQPIEYVQHLAQGGMAEMRALIFELRPESLELEGLVAALEKHAAATRSRYSIAVDLCLGEEPDIPLATKEALYRIAQEAMHNTVKHAHASTITIRLSGSANEIALGVTDDGCGFDSGASFPGHLGLLSMRERAERLGGCVTITSAPSAGTQVQVRLPR